MALTFLKVSTSKHEAKYRVDKHGTGVGYLSRDDFNSWTYTDANGTKSLHTGGFFKVARALREELRRGGG